MKRGDIWWAAPPLAGVRTKKRPFLIVSDDIFNSNAAYPKILVVHVTDTHRAGGPFAWEVGLPRGTARLPHASIAKCQEVYTIFKTQLASRVGSVPRDFMAKIDGALALALGLRMLTASNDT